MSKNAFSHPGATVVRLVSVLFAAGLVTSCTQQNAQALAQVIEQVQTDTKQACKFEPDAKPIVDLIPMFGNAATSIADAICSAVNSTPQAAAVPGAPVAVTVHNVTVTGVKVR